jgi:hypothetical protein
VDVVFRIAGHGGALAPLPAIGQVAPAFYELVLALANVNDFRHLYSLLSCP